MMSALGCIRLAPRRGVRGFSLVELMVAAVVGIVGILVITSVFVQSQGQNRTTTGGASAQENALIALATLEQDLRMAGIGLFGTGCTNANGYHSGMTPPTFPPFPPLPARITRDPGAASDGVTIIYSGSPFGNIWTTLTAAMPTSNDVLAVTNGNGYAQGDLIMISQPPNCSLIQASADAAVSDGVWTIEHLPGAATPFNPPAATNIFPAGGYPSGARVTNMGPMVRRDYFVQNGRLMAQDLNLPPGNGTNPVPVADGVVAVRAQYGRDTSGDGFVDTYDNTAPASAAQLVAVRIAVVARSGQLEKEDVSPAQLTLWNGGTLGNGGVLQLSLLGADARRYRYRVYQTIVPLRNIIWTP
jgi:type IV pilus assembly protein PilW